MGEEEFGMADGAKRAIGDRVHSGGCELLPGHSRQIQVAGRAPSIESTEVLMHLFADFVTAAARARTQCGLDRSASPQLAQGPNSFGQNSGCEPAPATVQRRDRSFAGERDRQAVGDEDESGSSGSPDSLSVGFRRSGRPGRVTEVALHPGFVHLSCVVDVAPRQPGVSGQQVSVRLHARDIVAHLRA
jgi:hypothetical protein